VPTGFWTFSASSFLFEVIQSLYPAATPHRTTKQMVAMALSGGGSIKIAHTMKNGVTTISIRTAMIIQSHFSVKIEDEDISVNLLENPIYIVCDLADCDS